MARVCGVEIFTSKSSLEAYMKLLWIGSEGFGDYDLTFTFDKNGFVKILGNSECMDSNEDKSFIKGLLLSLVDKIEITG